MKIGIDIDDTMFHNPIVMNTIKEFNLGITKHSWDLRELPAFVRDILFKRFLAPTYMCVLKPFPGNVEKVVEWHNAGHRIVGVTARLQCIHDETLTMFQKYCPFVEDVFCMEHHNKHDIPIHKEDIIGKNKILEEQGIDIFIEDSPKYIEAAFSLPNIKKFMVTNDDTNYNWELRDFLLTNPRPDVILVGSLKEVVI